MDKLFEESFVKNFIIKDKRERLLYELNNPKKRDNAIQRIPNLLEKKYEIPVNSKNSDEILIIANQYVKSNTECYIISDTVLDGAKVPFKEAFEHMLNSYMVCVVISADTVLLKDEYVIGPLSVSLFHKN